MIWLHECCYRHVGKQSQGITMSPPEVDGVSLKINSMHVGVSAHSNQMPRNPVIFAHAQAWLVAIHIAIDS